MDHRRTDRGAVGEGPVSLPWLGRSQLFRYEVRRWRGGEIPDAAEAVDSPQRLNTDPVRAEQILKPRSKLPNGHEAARLNPSGDGPSADDGAAPDSGDSAPRRRDRRTSPVLDHLGVGR